MITIILLSFSRSLSLSLSLSLCLYYNNKRLMTSSLLFCCVGWCLLLNNIILSLSSPSPSLSACLSLLVAVIGADVIDPAGSGK